MASVYVDDIEVSVGPYQERAATLRVSGIGGRGAVSHCQIVLSSLTVYQPPPPGSPTILGYIDPVTHRPVRFESTAGDREKLLVDTCIVSATMSPSTGTLQEADFGAGASSATLSDLSSVTFRLTLKTSTDEAAYARAAIVIHTF